MTMNQLASAIAKLEGKKSQAKIGDIRESLKTLIFLMANEYVESGSSPTSDLIVEQTKKVIERVAKKKAKA